MRESVIRENAYAIIIEVLHMRGKINLFKMFTKEERDKSHYLNEF